MVKNKALRFILARYGRAVRGMTLGVRIAAVDDRGRVMLVRHGYAPGWHFPGGGVEVGETAETAAIRELLEETGVEALDRPKLFGLYFNRSYGGRDHVALYRVDAFALGIEPTPNREIAERGWFALDALPDGTTPATRRRLDELFVGAASDGRW